MNSFNSRSTLKVGNKEYEIYRLDALDKQGISDQASAFSLRILAGEPAAHRRRPQRHPGGNSRAGRLEQQVQAGQRNRLHAQPRAAAGFHRRARRGRSRRHARRHEAPGRRSHADQSAAAGGVGDRSLRAGRRVRHSASLRDECGPGIPAQQRALRVPALGTDRLPQSRHRAARHRHRPPGESRISGARGLRAGIGRQAHRLSRHAGRHRLATPPWSMDWACWAGASAESKPRPPCWDSRCRC